MGRKTLLHYDGHDGRDQLNEMRRLLGDPRLGDRGRMAFIGWCCRKSGDKLVQVGLSHPKAGYGVEESLNDLCMMTLQYRLDADVALAELTRRVRRL